MDWGVAGLVLGVLGSQCQIQDENKHHGNDTLERKGEYLAPATPRNPSKDGNRHDTA